jgi:hypothetical protein
MEIDRMNEHELRSELLRDCFRVSQSHFAEQAEKSAGTTIFLKVGFRRLAVPLLECTTSTGQGE